MRIQLSLDYLFRKVFTPAMPLATLGREIMAITVSIEDSRYFGMQLLKIELEAELKFPHRVLQRKSDFSVSSAFSRVERNFGLTGSKQEIYEQFVDLLAKQPVPEGAEMHSWIIKKYEERLLGE